MGGSDLFSLIIYSAGVVLSYTLNLWMLFSEDAL